MKVCHLTSVHNWNDTRIFYKECITLSEAGYDVSLVVPHNKEETVKNIRILNVAPNTGGRLKRAAVTAYKIYKRAVAENAEIYHFHDPELIWIGILLRLKGKKVVFDVHENIRAQMKVKKWLPLRHFFSWLYGYVDWLSAKMFFLILAEDSYRLIYKNYGAQYEIVLNLPEIKQLNNFLLLDRSNLSNGILYVGGVTEERGIDTIIEALYLLNKKKIDFIFYCIGPIDEKYRIELLQKIKIYGMDSKIQLTGHIPIDKAYEFSLKCKVGLSILKPIDNYLNSYSTKVFEYMSIGLPAIVSNFKLYRFVEKHNCGICVDPLNPQKIADSIEMILSDDLSAKKMGENGRKAVESEYQWKTEANKLINFYKRI